MSYLETCFTKTDSADNKLEPSRNLIVLKLYKTWCLAFTISDMKAILGAPRKHYLNGEALMQTFFTLPDGSMIDIELLYCFKQKVNTMNLVRSPHRFINIKDNYSLNDYYTVEPVERKDIGSDEASTFE